MRQGLHWAGFVVESWRIGGGNLLSKLLIYRVYLDFIFGWSTSWNTESLLNHLYVSEVHAL